MMIELKMGRSVSLRALNLDSHLQMIIDCNISTEESHVALTGYRKGKLTTLTLGLVNFPTSYQTFNFIDRFGYQFSDIFCTCTRMEDLPFPIETNFQVSFGDNLSSLSLSNFIKMPENNFCMENTKKAYFFLPNLSGKFNKILLLRFFQKDAEWFIQPLGKEFQYSLPSAYCGIFS